MRPQHPARLSFEESCRHLLEIGCLHPSDLGGTFPEMPRRRPRYDDDLPFGVRFFRTWVGSGRPFGLSTPPDFDGGVDYHALERLTLPRTYFGRSEVSRISFGNTDLTESTLCWNDFIEVNFAEADLSGCDLRASRFVRTSFARAVLRDADLRWSTFRECDFTDADLRGAKLTHERGDSLPFSEVQRREIDWQQDEGEEPPGG